MQLILRDLGMWKSKSFLLFLNLGTKTRNIPSFWKCSLIQGISSQNLQPDFGKAYFLSLKVQNISLKLYFPTYHYFSSDLHKSNNDAAIALKSANKDNKDLTHNYEKKIRLMEEKVVELIEFKSEKLSEEKNFKSKVKKIGQ